MLKNRESNRLTGFDYSQKAAYFITICTYERKCLFGRITVGANGCSPDIVDAPKMILNKFGEIAQYEWEKSAKIRSEIILDEFVVMPNHIHGIVMIEKNNNVVGANDDISGANSRSPLQRRMKPKSISSFIAGYKSVVTKQINQIRNTPRQQVWQRNYYDHIIRNEQDLTRVREYIVNNPLKWEEDIENINYQNQSAGNGRDRSYMQAKNQRPHCESLG